MNLTKEELSLELEHLNKTLDATKEIIKEKETQQIKNKKDIVNSKRHLWQNKNEYSGVEAFTTMDEEDLKTNIINENQNKITKLFRSLYSPYFGKVTFKHDNEYSDIYIGLTGIEKDGKNFAYDWRAPISNIYYNYDIGPSKYETPSGVIRGENINKRQFKIESGRLLEAFNTDVTIEDELLQNVLLTNNTDKMKNIVSTIQREQNDIIRYSKKSDLIIEGVAGSGKTSVAMHRIAYLLYNDQKITNKNILIISPSDVFTNYISDILPDLGEEAVPTITIDDFIKKYIPYIGNDDTYNKDSKKKYEKSYIDELNNLLQNFFDTLKFKSKLGLKKKFITSDELNCIFKKNNRLSSISDRIDYLVEKICDIYDISYEKNSLKLKENIKKILNIPNNPIDLYKLITKENTPDSFISYISALYINFEVNGYPNTAHIKHVVIDEVQDYPYFLLKIIKKVFSSAQFTLLGDTHQSINEYFKYSNLSDIKEIFTTAKYIELKKTYRSSYEIIEYSNKILNIDDIKSIRRPSGIPVLEKTGTLIDVKKELNRLELKYNRTAVIIKNDNVNEVLKTLYDKNTALITENSLKPKLIVPISEIKGLEFDAVIIYADPNNKFTSKEKNLFYVSATRAVHELIVFNR